MEHVHAYFTLFVETARLELAETLRYRFSVISDTVLLALLFAFFIYSGTGSSFAGEYGVADHRPLLLAGYIAWMLASFSLSVSVKGITEELKRGTFYRKVSARLPMEALLLAQFVSALLTQIVEIAVLLLVSALAWGVVIPCSPVVLASFVFCALGMYGVGLTMAGLTLLFKRIGSMLTLVQICLLFVTDTLPTAPVLAIITSFLPLTFSNEVIKAAVSGGTSIGSFICLCCLSLAWLLVGYIVFIKLMAVSKDRGSLLLY